MFLAFLLTYQKQADDIDHLVDNIIAVRNVSFRLRGGSGVRSSG